MMSRFAVIERASIDEAYMDLTAAVQQRLKNLNDSPIDAHLLKATYIQGYPQTSPERPAAAEDVALDKGILKPLLTKRNYRNISPLNVMLRGAEISRCSAVAGDDAPPRGGRAELCRAAADRRSAHCGRNAGSRGKRHRVPVFGWNST